MLHTPVCHTSQTHVMKPFIEKMAQCIGILLDCLITIKLMCCPSAGSLTPQQGRLRCGGRRKHKPKEAHLTQNCNMIVLTEEDTSELLTPPPHSVLQEWEPDEEQRPIAGHMAHYVPVTIQAPKSKQRPLLTPFSQFFCNKAMSNNDNMLKCVPFCGH